MNRVVLSLGSNIDKERNLPAAVALLREMAEVTAVSTVYETVPTGLLDQPNFFNTAVLLRTTLSPTQIKEDLIAAVETALHRVRQDDKNAPRTIDLDLALYNDDVLDYVLADGRVRRLPDPDILKFPHVAIPIAELLPDLRHPETGELLSAIAVRLLAEQGEDNLWPRPDIEI
ncbi:MAG: 2-amino-4-hydroxy-6-hydroxymethyldihydropteridine diphosphokinase [Chloroflexi bacterium]|nr:2-amino-4-hydroxy-6-hydroxymethyldihydropteridine diphosphokinase [Chloroflexota bacterium]MBK7915800.1 2-amino-4-hydroxy-6-hydroxymethyldihydropteridine diphosphokinase [Chloroflexota bacterium]MBP6803972.1 2-amino-4-hydroxy-6-hydroxymethyldihydropteridine diphosphokinase [Chloroflexota bacterium]